MTTTVTMNQEQLEAFARASSLAGVIVDELPDVADDNDADLGVMALVMCGLLAGKLIASGLTREEFMRQMELAIDAKLRAQQMPDMPQ